MMSSRLHSMEDLSLSITVHARLNSTTNCRKSAFKPIPSSHLESSNDHIYSLLFKKRLLIDTIYVTLSYSFLL